MKEDLQRLARWQGRLGLKGRCLWRGFLRGSAVLFFLSLAWVFALGMGRDHSPLLLLGWGGWIAASVAVAGALEERFAGRAPWRTALACIALGWAASLGAIAQWGYMAGLEGGQVAGWQSALEAPTRVSKDALIALLLCCQLLGAMVLAHRGKVIGALCLANVAVLYVPVLIGLFLACAFEDWVWTTLEATPLESPDPEQGAKG